MNYVRRVFNSLYSCVQRTRTPYTYHTLTYFHSCYLGSRHCGWKEFFFLSFSSLHSQPISIHMGTAVAL